jgi:hypothetical protein
MDAGVILEEKKKKEEENEKVNAEEEIKGRKEDRSHAWILSVFVLTVLVFVWRQASCVDSNGRSLF